MAEIERLPREVFDAALRGEIATIKNWLDQGGDPDQAIEQVFNHTYRPGTTLLMAAASRDRLDAVRLLIDHGADVNVRVPEGYRAGWSALIFAATTSCSVDCVEYLLARGAETSGIVDGTRIICNKNAMLYDLLGSPRIVRMLLAKGLVLTTARFDNFFNYGSLEESAKKRARYLRRDSRPDK